MARALPLGECDDFRRSAPFVFDDSFLGELNGSQEGVQLHDALDAHSLGVALADVDKSVFDPEHGRLINERNRIEYGQDSPPPVATLRRNNGRIPAITKSLTNMNCISGGPLTAIPTDRSDRTRLPDACAARAIRWGVFHPLAEE